ncbi:MAG: hypothetical protein IKF99_06095 [Oscillospiraceae bacterium]|nr:hypothetical protein [Oscillospiraceae bacterium]
MRLIDADALTERMKSFLCDPKKCDNYGGVRCRACEFDDAFYWIDAEPTVDAVPPEVVTHNCVPIKPLARWLAGYAFPPGLKAREIVNNRGRDIHEIAAEGWEAFLRGMDWGGDK